MSASADSVLTSKEKQPTPKRSSRISPSAPKRVNTELLELAEQVAHFGSWEFDVTKTRAKWSREMFRIFGLKPQDEGLTLEEYRSFIHPDDLKEVTERMQNAFKHSRTKGELDYRIIRSDGSVRTIHSIRQIKEKTGDGKVRVVVGVDQDVTEQRIAEQINAENIKLLALAERMADFGSWELDIAQPRATWSPGLFRIFGVHPREEGFTWDEYLSFIHPDDRDAASKNAQTMFNSPLYHREKFDYRIIRGDGQTRILHGQRQVVEATPEGKVRVVVGVDQDITEQKQAEEALKRSEERFRAVAEAANVTVYEYNLAESKLEAVNGSEKLIGFTSLPGNCTLDWIISRVHPDDRQHVADAWRQATENPTVDRYSMTYRFKHKNGHYIVLKDTAKAVKDPSGKTVFFVGGIRDITQRVEDREKIEQYNKRLEELVAERTKQLISLERLAAIGEVAGMVGHDIRNPLQALTGEIYLIRSTLDAITDPDLRQEVTECLNSADEDITYINKIVADLQDYSRKLNPELVTVDINQIVNEVLKTINLPQKIQLNLNITPQTKLTADPTFLRRVLTNLVNNAVQAMPDGGNLTIAGAQENNTTAITIHDTGVGIPPEVQTKIFTPMFTTKAKGQGLGLAVVKRLIEAQGGTISFQSQPGKGTVFTVHLPTHAGA